MLPLLATIFLASLMGSLHCAGMCGAFVAFAVGGPGATASRAALHAVYNLGRLITYLVLGVLAGALGQALDLGGTLVGVQRSAAILAGALMVLFGLVSLGRLSGAKIRGLAVPAWLNRLNMAGHRAAMALPPVPRAGAVGLLTTLLPCGWLYAFVITAAGTAHPLWGAAAMGVFWLGTLPMLVIVGAGVQKLAGVLGPKLPLLTSTAIVVVGLYTIVTRMEASTAVAAALPRPAASPAAALQQLQGVNSKEMPCCRDRSK